MNIEWQPFISGTTPQTLSQFSIPYNYTILGYLLAPGEEPDQKS